MDSTGVFLAKNAELFATLIASLADPKTRQHRAVTTVCKVLAGGYDPKDPERSLLEKLAARLSSEEFDGRRQLILDGLLAACSEAEAEAEAEAAEGDYLSKDEVIDAIRETVEMRKKGAEALVVDPTDTTSARALKGVEGILTVRQGVPSDSSGRDYWDELARDEALMAKRRESLAADPGWVSKLLGLELAEANAELREQYGAELVVAGEEVGDQAMRRGGNSTHCQLFLVTAHEDEDALRHLVARAIEIVGAGVANRPGVHQVARGKRKTVISAKTPTVPRSHVCVEISHTVWASVGNLVASFGAGTHAFASDGVRFYESPMGRLARRRRAVVLDPSTFDEAAARGLIRALKARIDLVIPGAGPLGSDEAWDMSSLENRLSRYAAVDAAADPTPGKAREFPILPWLSGLRRFSLLDKSGTGALAGFSAFVRHRKNSWDGEGPEFEPLFPEEGDRDAFDSSLLDSAALAHELAARLEKKTTAPLSCDYFRLPPDPSTWAAYCSAIANVQMVPLKAVGGGVRAILESFALWANHQAKPSTISPTERMLLSSEISDPEVLSERATALIADASVFMLEGWGADGAEFLVGPAEIPGEDDYDLTPAYLCSGFPYWHIDNDFDQELQL